jgi:hypothetical protein
MTSTHSIRVELPSELFEQLQQAADRSDQPIEAVLVDSLAMLFGTPRADWEQLAGTLETLTDAQLLALVYRRITWPEGARLRELSERGKHTALSDDEQTELAALIDEADRLMLLRSRALLLLRQRGHESAKLLTLGA